MSIDHVGRTLLSDNVVGNALHRGFPTLRKPRVGAASLRSFPSHS